MLKSLIGAAMKETFGVATQPEQQTPSAVDLLQATIIKETLGVATKPAEDLSLVDLAFQTLNQEMFGVATAPEAETSSKIGAVLGKVTEQVTLETIGSIAALALKDIQSGVLTQANPPEPEGPSLLSRGLKGAKDIWKGRQDKSAAKKTQKAAEEAEAQRKKKQADDLNHAQAMANAHKDSAQAQAQGAAAAMVTTQSLANIIQTLNAFRQTQGGSASSQPNQSESPDIIDGVAKDIK